jgi:hypothetical protein
MSSVLDTQWEVEKRCFEMQNGKFRGTMRSMKDMKKEKTEKSKNVLR